MPSIILFAAWKNFGYNMIILLAALQAVPREIYESARVDGAGPMRQFTDLTFPMLTPTLVMVGIMTLAGYFQLFAEPYVMTQGGPLRSTVSVLYFMYEEGFRWWNLGYASAVAFVLFIIIFVVSAGLLALRPRSGRKHGMNPRLAVWVVNGLLAGLAALSLFPLLWMVSVSFMPAGASSTIPTPVVPGTVTLDNYRTLFGNVGMGRYLLNSLAIAVLATLISVAST
jgi:ABC-type sugar transport system permease subunit